MLYVACAWTAPHAKSSTHNARSMNKARPACVTCSRRGWINMHAVCNTQDWTGMHPAHHICTFAHLHHVLDPVCRADLQAWFGPQNVLTYLFSPSAHEFNTFALEDCLPALNTLFLPYLKCRNLCLNVIFCSCHFCSSTGKAHLYWASWFFCHHTHRSLVTWGMGKCLFGAVLKVCVWEERGG